MPVTEEKALEILLELIRKPESPATQIPTIWKDVLAVYDQQFAPPVEQPKKKRRRRAGANPNLGWPQGVSRAEYAVWKEAQQKRGISDGLNPQEYKRQKDAGLLDKAPATRAAKPEATKAEKPKAAGKAKK